MRNYQFIYGIDVFNVARGTIILTIRNGAAIEILH